MTKKHLIGITISLILCGLAYAHLVYTVQINVHDRYQTVSPFERTLSAMEIQSK